MWYRSKRLHYIYDYIHYIHKKLFSYSDISICVCEFLCCLPSFLSFAEIRNICSSGSKNNRITEYFELERTHKYHCRKYLFFPLGNKLVSRICLNFLWSMLGTVWWSSDSVLCGHTENPLCSLSSVSFCQAYVHTINEFGIRANFFPSELGREKVSWDI